MSSLALHRGRVAKNTLAQVVTLVLGTAVFGFAAIAVARRLGPDGLGVFSPAWQLAITLSVIALLGLDQQLIRTLNRGAGRREVRATLRGASALAVCVGGAAALLPALAGAPSPAARAYAAAGAFVALSGPALVLRSVFHARERMELETAVIVLETAVSLAAISLALITGGGAASVILALGVGRGFGLALALLLLGRASIPEGAAITPVGWRRRLAGSLPLGISFAFTTMVVRADIVVVGALRPAREAGIYGAAAVITFTLPLLVTSLTRSLYPVLSRASGADDPELRRVFGEAWRGLLVLGFGAAAALTVLAGPAIVLVYGQGFEPAATVLRALAWLLPVRFLNSLCATTLNATTWRRHQAAALGGAVGLNLLANIALVPVFGMWGAVYAAAASEAILLVVLVVALRKLLPSLVGQFAGAVLAVVPVGAVATMIPGHVVVRAAGAGLALAAVALATGALDVLGARVPGRMGDTLAQLAGTLHR